MGGWGVRQAWGRPPQGLSCGAWSSPSAQASPSPSLPSPSPGLHPPPPPPLSGLSVYPGAAWGAAAPLQSLPSLPPAQAAPGSGQPSPGARVSISLGAQAGPPSSPWVWASLCRVGQARASPCGAVGDIPLLLLPPPAVHLPPPLPPRDVCDDDDGALGSCVCLAAGGGAGGAGETGSCAGWLRCGAGAPAV